MGMFTTIIHEGQELQIKHGWDDCDVYQVGDRIEWSPDPRYPGDHIDGVYDSCSEDRSDPWVVIKDCVIVAVVPRRHGAVDLVMQYGITAPDRNLWTPEQWQMKATREAAAEAAYQAWAEVHGDNPAAYYMHLKLQESSVLERVLPAHQVSG